MSGQEMTQRTPAQQLVAHVRSDKFRQQVAMALPPTVTPERFVRVVTAALIANPDIAKLDHESVLTAMVRAAADGLIPDGREAAITPRGGKATYVPMIGGFRKLAAEHGWTLRTAVVYAADRFEHAVVNGDEVINHVPVRPGDQRGDLIAAYAIAKHRDGRKMFAVLHPDDVAKRRASASTQNVWNEHPAAMWEKSAGRDLFAQLGLGELDERVERVLAASNTDPAEASRMIYGPPPTETAGALPAAVDHQDDRATTSPPDPAERDVQVDDGQQAAAAASPTQAAAVPGPEPEPSLAEEPQFNAPAGADDDPIVAAGREAAKFMIPRGDHKGLSLADAHAKGPTGVRWLRWAISNIGEPDEYRRAVWAFCRVYEPELYQEALAKQEAAA